MVGNINYIIDDVAEKLGLPREYVKVLAEVQFMEWKRSISTTDCISIKLCGLGYWTTSHSKLKGFVRSNIKKLRKVREAMKDPKYTPLQQETLKVKEALFIKNIRITWKQIKSLQILLAKKDKKVKNNIKKYYEINNRIPEANS